MTEEITYYCALCDRSETQTIPTNFVTRYRAMDVENAMCPDHAGVAAFLDDQCPGCVSGWGECGMSTAIGNYKVRADHLALIRSGQCPFRVNGTMAFCRGGFERVDLSQQSKSGGAFANAIEELQKQGTD